MRLPKTAVPFFLIVSGYFCYRDDPKLFSKRLGRQILKLTILCILANVLYFLWYYRLSGASSYKLFHLIYINERAWKDFLLVNQSPYADHLWFLGSIVYAMAILWLLTKLRIHNYVLWLSPVLLGVYLHMARSENYDFIYCRNALFCTMPYFMYGCLIQRYEEKIKKLNPFVTTGALILFIGLSFAEFWHYRDVNVTFLSTECLVVVLVLFLIRFPNIGRNSIFEHLGRRDTLFLYIVHYAFVMYIGFHYMYALPGYIEHYGTLLIFFVTLLLAECCQGIKKAGILLWKKCSVKESKNRIL